MVDSDYIEVRTKIRRRRILKVAYNQSPSDQTKIPSIRFSGGYLEDLGFVVGGDYELCVNHDNTITIRAIGPDEKIEDEDTDQADS